MVFCPLGDCGLGVPEPVFTWMVPDQPLIEPVLQPPCTPSICASNRWDPGLRCTSLSRLRPPGCTTSGGPIGFPSAYRVTWPGAHAGGLGSAVNQTTSRSPASLLVSTDMPCRGAHV